MSERTSYVLPGIALILIGFATGWFLQGARQGAKPRPLLPAPPTKTTRINEALRIAIDELGAVSDPGARHEAVERIPPGEMRTYLQGLRNRAGLRGLSENDRDLLSTMLAVWHARNPKDAFTWVLAHEDEASRIDLLYRMFEAAYLTDPIAAMRFGVTHMITRDGKFRIPPEILQAALREGPDVLLECLKLAVHPAAVGTNLDLVFPEDFDHAAFAAALVGHVHSLPAGTHQLVLPRNFVNDWAEQDPVAAFLWASHHPDVATPQGLRDSLAAIAESPPKLAGAILAEAMQAENADPELVTEGLATVLHSEPNPQILTRFLSSFETDQAQMDYLATLFVDTMGPDPDRHSPRVRHLILSRMTSEQRLSFLDDILQARHASPGLFHLDAQFDSTMREELTRLEHTDEEINVIMDGFLPPPVSPSP